MGASLALAGMTGCKPVRSDDVVPFVNRPDGFIEGRTGHYATAVLFDGYAQPVLATTSAGRPIKLDGNPDHPAFRGGSTPFMQAAISTFTIRTEARRRLWAGTRRAGPISTGR